MGLYDLPSLQEHEKDSVGSLPASTSSALHAVVSPFPMQVYRDPEEKRVAKIRRIRLGKEETYYSRQAREVGVAIAGAGVGVGVGVGGGGGGDDNDVEVTEGMAVDRVTLELPDGQI